jgi:hypothetical protein
MTLLPRTAVLATSLAASRSRGRGVFVAAFAGVVIGCPWTRAGAQDVTLQSAGGSGGDPVSLSCGSQALVGLHGQGGTNILGQAVVFNLAEWCVGLNADGSWNGNPGINLGASMGHAAAIFPVVDMKCPKNMAVSGIKGRAGSYVSDVEIVCSALGPGGKLTGSPRAADASAGATQIAGGSVIPDAAFGTFLCPNSYPGKGLTGRAHDWVDQIALVCGTPTDVQPPVVVATSVPQGFAWSGLSTPAAVTLNAPAPAGGTTVTFPGNVGFSTSPSPIVVPSGQKTVSFAIVAITTASRTLAVVTPSPATSSSAYASFNIFPPALWGLSLSSNYVTLGNTTTGRVSIEGKAFAGGLAVVLSTGDASVATVPSSVVVAAGDTTATFPVTLTATGNGCTYVRATYDARSKDAYVAVAPPVGFVQARSKLPIGLSGTVGSTQLTVSFLLPSASARTVTMTSSNPSIVAVPTTITVPANASSATVGLTITNPAGTSACATVTARDGSGSSNSVILMLQGASITAVAG